MIGVLLDRPDAVAAARRSAADIADLVLAHGSLPGVLGAGWVPRARYACLTGNAQMALIWLWLHELDGDPRFRRAADRVIDLVGSAQQLGTRAEGIRGGIPGSDPIWGDYVQFGLPNWAAKFYVDALIAQAGPRTALQPLADGVSAR